MTQLKHLNTQSLMLVSIFLFALLALSIFLFTLLALSIFTLGDLVTEESGLEIPDLKLQL